MRKIGYMLISIIVTIVFIPVIVLQGVGPGLKPDNGSQKGIVNFTGENKKEETVFDDKNGGGPKLKVYIVENKTVNEMYLEEYIRGVLSGEMPAEFDVEALKAQAVAARTYTVTRMKAYGGKGCSDHPEADICTDSTHCQEWISKEDRFKYWNAVEAPKLWEKVTGAVTATKGIIMTYNTAPVMYPMYFSTSSGKTENSQDIFTSQQPYLRSVVSPNEDAAPKFTSKTVLTRDEFIKKFSQSKFKVKLDKTKLHTQVSIISRTEGGSVKNVKMGEATLKGTDVREILSLNSANFRIDFDKNDVIVTVLGYGHGVGMSQWGANVMAQAGRKYDDILKHYYQGVDLSKIEDVYKTK